MGSTTSRNCATLSSQSGNLTRSGPRFTSRMVSCGSVIMRVGYWQGFPAARTGSMCCGWRSRGQSASPHVVATMPGSVMISSGMSTLALCNRWGQRAWCAGYRSWLTLSSCATSASPASTSAPPSPSRPSIGWTSRSISYTVTCAAPSHR
jgi:hypothetical protein